MNIQIVIAILLLLLIIGIVLWFYKNNKTIEQLHAQTISELERNIFTNRSQINFRNTHLNKYNFLNYNLQEALVIQREIKLYNGFQEE